MAQLIEGYRSPGGPAHYVPPTRGEDARVRVLESKVAELQSRSDMLLSQNVGITNKLVQLEKAVETLLQNQLGLDEDD